MTAYYNDVDPKVAAWVSELVAGKQITDGTVDGRSIADVRADDLREYERCHFFAGIGGWERTLKNAGWPADRPVWTGSCPCQPFSCAGKGKGTDDERHLWPEFLRLITECRPPTIFGEQVASKAGKHWLSGVRVDLERLGYVVGAADLCAPCAGEESEGWVLRGDLSSGTLTREPMRIGPPHIRQRLYWVASLRVGHTGGQRRQQISGGASCDEKADGRKPNTSNLATGPGEDGSIGLSDAKQQNRRRRGLYGPGEGIEAPVERAPNQLERDSYAGGAPDARSDGQHAGRGGSSGEGGAELHRKKPCPDHIPGHRRDTAVCIRPSNDACGPADSKCPKRGTDLQRDVEHGTNAEWHEAASGLGACDEYGGLQRTDGAGREPGRPTPPPTGHGHPVEPTSSHGAVSLPYGRHAGRVLPIPAGDRRVESRRIKTHSAGSIAPRNKSCNWSNCDILPFKDGKARRVESSTFPLVTRLPKGVVQSGDPSDEEVQATDEERVMRLKGYGNSIVPQVAAVFVRAYLEAEREL